MDFEPLKRNIFGTDSKSYSKEIEFKVKKIKEALDNLIGFQSIFQDATKDNTITEEYIKLEEVSNFEAWSIQSYDSAIQQMDQFISSVVQDKLELEEKMALLQRKEITN